jgi:hypothetical protein
MQFFFSGEIDARVDDAWRAVARPLQHRLNAALGQRDYGPAVREFALIPMIMRPEWRDGFHKERRLWKRREAVADYRTWIDFDHFLAADAPERERLLVENLLAAVRDVQRKAGQALDGEALVADILAALDGSLAYGETRKA